MTAINWQTGKTQGSKIKTISYEEIAKKVKEYEDNELEKIIETIDPITGKASYAETSGGSKLGTTIAQDENKILNFVVDRMASSISTSMLTQMLSDSQQMITSPKAGKTFSPDDPQSVGSSFGEFIEMEAFGYPPDNKPVWDVEEIETELKAHSGEASTKINVGDLTIVSTANLSVEKGTAEIQASKNTIILYKMVMKMANFLFFRVEKGEVTTTEARGRISEMILNTHLLIRKIKDMIEGRIKTSGAIETHLHSDIKGDADEGFKQILSIKLSVKKINGVYKFFELYMRHMDLLQDLSNNDSFRKGFWQGIETRKLSFVNLNSNDGNPPIPIRLV